MPRGKRRVIRVKKLSKGDMRKLTALRKSLGKAIADRAFAAWYQARGSSGAAGSGDRDADTIAASLWKMVRAKKLRVSRRGYTVKRGRGRLIVEAVAKAA